MSRPRKSALPAAFGEDPRHVVEEAPKPAGLGHRETVFALANGHVGLRGAYEERSFAGVGGSRPAAFLAGVYEEEEIAYGESAHGFPRINERIVAVADPSATLAAIDGEPFDLATGELLDHRRLLDFASGTVVRELRWRAPSGAVLSWRSRRFVSLASPDSCVFVIDCTIENRAARIDLVSRLDSRPARGEVADDDPRRASAGGRRALTTLLQRDDGMAIAMVERTRHSGIHVAAAMVHELAGGREAAGSGIEREEGMIALHLHREVAAGETLRLVKVASLARVDAGETPEALADAAIARARAAAARGTEALAADHRAVLDSFFAVADIEIDGAPEIEQGLRFNLFHLFQSMPRDGRHGFPAKGLTGDGYDGHLFWDSEIYMLPVFAHLAPDLARTMLEVRHLRLDAARARAREMSQSRGALYPWRTIAGRECSAFFPAGTAQYHINADIAHAVETYRAATGDEAFMTRAGNELLVETARLWPELGHFTATDRFEIHGVTGPDEYSALVNNNAYTNFMARAHLRAAARAGRALGVAADEIALWERIADAIRLPRDPAHDIPAQDDAFPARRDWPWPEAPRPLLLHFHPLVLYRHKVIKQADTLLAMMLHPDAFDDTEVARAFDVYEPLTVHDSSLSPCVHGILAARIGRMPAALGFFRDTVRIDLDDRHGNSADGIHAAAMAGSWLGLVAGFAGLRMKDGQPRFRPRLPEGWAGYRFRVMVRGSRLAVEVAGDYVSYRNEAGPGLRLVHESESLELACASVLTRPLAGNPAS